MKKRWLALGIVCALTIGTMAGCGGKNDSASDNQQKSTEVEKTEDSGKQAEESKEQAQTEGTGDETVITMSHWGGETDEKTYRERADLYEASHPGVKIEINYMPSDHIQKLNTMFAGGTAPDIVVLAEDVHSFSSKGLLLPLDDYVEQAGIDVTARVGQTAVDTYSYDGKLYGIADRGGSMVLFYNKDMFDAAGVAYPTSDWTWEDMLAASKAMTGGSGEDETWGFGSETWWPYWMNWIYQAGGRVIDDDGNLVINSPESVKGLTFLQELTTVHDVMPTREEYANMGSGASAGTVFAQGRIGMVENGLWFFSSLQDVDFNYDVVEAFGGDKKVTVAAGSGTEGEADGPAAQASFSGPKGVAVAADGTIYVADTDNGTVRRGRGGQVTTILSRGPRDVTALFPAAPTGLLIQGNTLYISDTFARKLLALPLD